MGIYSPLHEKKVSVDWPITDVCYRRNTGLALDPNLALMLRCGAHMLVSVLKHEIHRLALKLESKVLRLAFWCWNMTLRSVFWRATWPSRLAQNATIVLRCWWIVMFALELKRNPRVDMSFVFEILSSVIFRQPTAVDTLKKTRFLLAW